MAFLKLSKYFFRHYKKICKNGEPNFLPPKLGKSRNERFKNVYKCIKSHLKISLKFPIISFACNAKSFAIAFLFFLSVFPSRRSFSTNWKNFLTNVFWFVIQKVCDQDRTHFIGHTKTCFRKNCSLSFYSQRAWYILFTYSRHPRKHTKQLETRKQVS